MKKFFCMIMIAVLICLCACSQSDDIVKKDEINVQNETEEVAGEEEMRNEDVICGGVTDTSDYNAPKEIESENLVSISVGFFHYGKYDLKAGGYYSFAVEPDDNGKLFLKDNFAEQGIEVDRSVFDGVQAIIKKHELAQLNGIHKITAGLAPEYSECFLEAAYDSGEYISFSGNSDPACEWTGELLEFFAGIFSENGNDKYMVPELEGVITRFCLEVKEENMIYSYDSIKVPLEGTEFSVEEIATGEADQASFEDKIYGSTYDMNSDADEERVYAYPSAEYYEGIFEILKEMEIRDFENYNSYSDFSEDPENYYCFYIEFETGDIMSGASDNPEEFEAFKPMADSLMEYMNNYLATH